MFECFRVEEIRDKDNETSLKEGRNRNVKLQLLFHIRDALALSSLEILTLAIK